MARAIVLVDLERLREINPALVATLNLCADFQADADDPRMETWSVKKSRIPTDGDGLRILTGQALQALSNQIMAARTNNDVATAEPAAPPPGPGGERNHQARRQ